MTFCHSICLAVSQLRDPSLYRDETKLIHFESSVPLSLINFWTNWLLNVLRLFFFFLIESLWVVFCWNSSLCLVSSNSWNTGWILTVQEPSLYSVLVLHKGLIKTDVQNLNKGNKFCSKLYPIDYGVHYFSGSAIL